MSEPIDDAFIDGWVQRLLDETPGIVTVILKGSLVQGRFGPHSDVDFDVLTDGDEERWPAWLVPHGDRLVHVSVAVQGLEGWLAEADEPVSWAYGLPAREPTRVLWAADDAVRERLDHPFRPHPAGEPELEDAVEGLGKMKNAALRDDDLGMRLAARKMGELIPSLLLPLNAVEPVAHPRAAIDALLAFPVAPAGYRDDLLGCLGLAPTALALGAMLAAGERLLLGTLALLREHQDIIVPLVPAGLADALVSGDLERYAARLVHAPTQAG